MKKEGIVIKLDGKYLEVLMLENAHCNTFEKESINSEAKVHDCSSCSGCSTIGTQKVKIIRVLNKTKKDVKVGDKISYSLNFLPLQFFIIVFLPFLAFALTFLSLHLYSFSEGQCILFSFLTSFLIIGLNFFTKKLLEKIFIPYI